MDLTFPGGLLMLQAGRAGAVWGWGWGRRSSLGQPGGGSASHERQSRICGNEGGRHHRGPLAGLPSPNPCSMLGYLWKND